MANNPFKKGWKFKGNTTKPGDHKWDEYENELTGESTLKVYTPKTVADFNCDHFFEAVDGPNVQCNKCTLGQRLGATQILRDGKIVRL